LLAGALGVVALSFVLRAERKPTAWLSLGAAALGASLVANGGTVFFLPAVAVAGWAGLRGRPIGDYARGLACAVVLLTTVLGPWQLYQRFCDPPGDALLRIHLAGAAPDDPRPLLTTIRAAYARLGLAQAIEYKWENLRTLIGPLNRSLVRPKDWRALQFFHLVHAIGILNIAWLGLLLPRHFRSGRSSARDGGGPDSRAPRNDPAESRRLVPALAGALLSLLFWVLVMFGPSSTTVHQGSYATVLLLFCVLTAYLHRLPAAVVRTVVALQVVVFLVLWVIPPLGPGVMIPNVPAAMIFGSCLVAVVGLASGERRPARFRPAWPLALAVALAIVFVFAPGVLRLAVIASEREAIDLVARFPDTEKRTNRPSFDDAFGVFRVTIDGVSRMCLLAVPFSRITWTVDVPPGAVLETAMAIRPRLWTGGGAVFRIGVSSGDRYDELLRQEVNPLQRETDRRWIPIALPLSAYAGRRVRIIFNTGPGTDPAVWGAPRIALH
jgi:hypothetical protein